MKTIRIFGTSAILALTLAGCQTMAAGDAESVICTSFQPITYSRNDTQLTRDQVTEFNAALAAICTPP